MAVNPIKIYQGSPGTVEETIYVVETGKKIIIKGIMLINLVEKDSLVHLYIKPASETLKPSHEILSPTPIKPLNTRLVECSIVLESNDSLVIKQEVSKSTNVYISGVEVV